jgi:ubiquinone biosynthesis protein UbiJ
MISDAINDWIVRFPEARTHLTALEGRSMLLQVYDWDVCLHLSVSQERLVIQWTVAKADVCLEGTGEALLSFLKIGWLKQATVPHVGLNIQGNVQVADAFKALFAKVPWEAEPHLARFIGDRGAYYTCRLAHKAARGMKSLASNMLDQFTEFQAYECNDWAEKEAVDDFCGQVDQLRYRIEKLEAQVEAD